MTPDKTIPSALSEAIFEALRRTYTIQRRGEGGVQAALDGWEHFSGPLRAMVAASHGAGWSEHTMRLVRRLERLTMKCDHEALACPWDAAFPPPGLVNAPHVVNELYRDMVAITSPAPATTSPDLSPALAETLRCLIDAYPAAASYKDIVPGTHRTTRDDTAKRRVQRLRGRLPEGHIAPGEPRLLVPYPKSC